MPAPADLATAAPAEGAMPMTTSPAMTTSVAAPDIDQVRARIGLHERIVERARQCRCGRRKYQGQGNEHSRKQLSHGLSSLCLLNVHGVTGKSGNGFRGRCKKSRCLIRRNEHLAPAFAHSRSGPVGRSSPVLVEIRDALNAECQCAARERSRVAQLSFDKPRSRASSRAVGRRALALRRRRGGRLQSTDRHGCERRRACP